MDVSESTASTLVVVVLPVVNTIIGGSISSSASS
jgi:hypothetical protein